MLFCQVSKVVGKILLYTVNCMIVFCQLTYLYFIYIFCDVCQGWHVVGEGIPVAVGGQDVVSLWQLTAPYMARLIAIVKHRSSVNLRLLNSSLGRKIINMLELVRITAIAFAIMAEYMQLNRNQ